MEFVGLRTKVHHLDEDYVWVPKMKDFTEDPKKEIWGDQGLGDVLETSFGSTTLQEVVILHTLVYFHLKGCFGSISTLRSVWIRFLP